MTTEEARGRFYGSQGAAAAAAAGVVGGGGGVVVDVPGAGAGGTHGTLFEGIAPFPA